MMMVISPAKKQEQTDRVLPFSATKPRQLSETGVLVEGLQKCEVDQLQSLLRVSRALAELNESRLKALDLKRFSRSRNAECAVYAYQGDVYKSIGVDSFSQEVEGRLQSRLRIISALYGLVRPYDLIQLYRLEMSTPYSGSWGRTLYDFWGDGMTKLLKKDVEKERTDFVLNLASADYSKAIDWTALGAPTYHVCFKNKRSGMYKTVGLLAKRARGAMVRYLSLNEQVDLDVVCRFSMNGYQFNELESSSNVLVFCSDE